MAAELRIWIERSVAQLEGMEQEHLGLTQALADIERRVEEVRCGVENNDEVLDRLEEELEGLERDKHSLEQRRRRLARQQAELWDRLLELWKRREMVQAAELALTMERERHEQRRRALPGQLQAADSQRRQLEHRLANLHALRREVAEEVAHLELDMHRLVSALERVADSDDEAEQTRVVQMVTPRLRLVPPPPPAAALPPAAIDEADFPSDSFAPVLQIEGEPSEAISTLYEPPGMPRPRVPSPRRLMVGASLGLVVPLLGFFGLRTIGSDGEPEPRAPAGEVRVIDAAPVEPAALADTRASAAIVAPPPVAPAAPEGETSMALASVVPIASEAPEHAERAEPRRRSKPKRARARRRAAKKPEAKPTRGPVKISLGNDPLAGI